MSAIRLLLPESLTSISAARSFASSEIDFNRALS
jgi:hypothetical protein